jgi:hypothetical protein
MLVYRFAVFGLEVLGLAKHILTYSFNSRK